MRPDCDKSPNERSKDKKNVDCGKVVIFKAELNQCECEVESKIEYKRKSDEPWDLFSECFIKYRAERNCDNGVKHSPHRPKEPTRRRPVGFY